MVESSPEELSAHSVSRGVTRRDLLVFGTGLIAGAATLYLGANAVRSGDDSHVESVTNLADATRTLDAGRVRPIVEATLTGEPWYPPDPSRRLAVVSFDSSDRALAEMYLERAGDADYAVSGGRALVALILRDPLK